MNVKNVIGEALQGIRMIKVFAQESRENRFAKPTTAVKRTIPMGNLWMTIPPRSAVIAGFGLIVWYSGGRTCWTARCRWAR